MKRILCLLLLLLPLCGCGHKEETAPPEFVLTYAENQPEHYPTTVAAQRFAELVEQRTGGKVVIQVRHSGEFGSQADVLNQLYIGGVDFARISLSPVCDKLPALNVLQLPYLYRDADHMWRVLDGQIGEDFLGLFDEINLVGLSWYDAGARCFYSDWPINSASDMAGRTVRVQDSQMMMDMVELLGGIPVNLAYSDVYAAFETDQIDVAENNWPSYEIQAHYKRARFFTLDQHTRVPEVQLASERTWNQLPEAYREIIRQCARESADYQRQLWASQEMESRDNAIARGCQEIVLPEEELAQFRALVLPLYERYCGDHKELIDRIRSG